MTTDSEAAMTVPLRLLRRLQPVLRSALACVAAASTLAAQLPDTSVLQPLRWRMIGPHRGGRTVGAAGVPQRPGWFYIGVNNGGVWR